MREKTREKALPYHGFDLLLLSVVPVKFIPVSLTILPLWNISFIVLIGGSDIDHRKTKFFFFVPYYHTTSTLFTIYVLLPRLPTVSLYSRTTVGIHKQLPCVCLFCKPTWVVPCQSEIWHSLLPLLSPAEKETERLKNLLQDIFEFISIFFFVCWIFFGQHLGHLWHSPAFQSWGKSSWVKFIFNHIFYLSHR